VLDSTAGPALDLFCGTRPYESFLAHREVWALDIDRHFGGANVIGSVPLPFRDGAFAVVLCTQALYLVDDPVTTVNEMRRVIMPGGHAVVTVPYLFRRESSGDRRFTRRELQDLFQGWHDMDVASVGGPATGAALYMGQLAAGASRRWPVLRSLLSGASLILNACASLADLVARPLAIRWPASFIVVVRRPHD
jgi:SAM-dependent methyltransferase